jgi:uncharacterized protein (TIGR03000 family)
MRQRYFSALTSSLAMLALACWSINLAAAGHGGGGGHGAGGHGGGGHSGGAHGGNWNGGNSHGGNWNGGNWHGNNWHGGWYGGWYGWGGWFGPGWYGWRGGNWGGGGYGGDQPYGYYDDYPTYGYNYYPGAPGYSSFYSGPEDSGEARIMIHVPPDATVYFDGELTRGQGEVRRFESPPLDPDGSYTYEIRAVWDENGRTVDRVKKIHVRAGQLNALDFLAPGSPDVRGGETHNPNTNRNRTRDRDPTLPPPHPQRQDQNQPPTL